LRIGGGNVIVPVLMVSGKWAEKKKEKKKK